MDYDIVANQLFRQIFRSSNFLEKFNLRQHHHNIGDSVKSPKILAIESLYKNKVLILEETLTRFVNKTSIFPKIGLELEFYLTNQDYSVIDIENPIIYEFIAELVKLAKNCDLIYKIEKEQGVGQIEIKTTYTSDLLKTCNQISEIKKIAQKLALKKKLVVSFDSQPFIDDCGSALQFNISLHNEKDENLFLQQNELLNSIIAVLLYFTEQTFLIFSPDSKDYLRFDEKINQNLYKKGKYPAPINLSFGVENRTCAIRIPLQKNDNLEIVKEKDCATHKKRVEYRIAAANSDPYLAISTILIMLLKGIKQKLSPKDLGFEQIYGNAFDKQYNIKSFPKSYEEAFDKFNYNFFDL
jgi:gamma-glutamylputrescine synthase